MIILIGKPFTPNKVRQIIAYNSYLFAEFVPSTRDISYGCWVLRNVNIGLFFNKEE
jgi:hypothetical protein